MPSVHAGYHPQVGDQVRVVLRDDRDCPEAPHFLGEERRLGRIVVAKPTQLAPDHQYLVEFRCGTMCALASGRLIEICARYYAADELELIA